MKKFIYNLITLLFVFLIGCGYTPIYTKKNINFNIQEINFSGEKNINRKINQLLNAYKNSDENNQEISITINSSKNINIVSRNSKGEAQAYKINIQVDVKAFINQKNILKLNIQKSSTFNAVSRKSEQKLIENKIYDNLSNEIAEEIILRLIEKTA